MAYIYKITNLINNKSYIGQTSTSIQKRFQGHILDSHKENLKNRPLYRAMRKYGVENFQIQLVEEVSRELLSEREQYWILYYNTYRNGYNATLGGEGKPLYNYQEIIDKYKEIGNQSLTAEFFNCDKDVVKRALSSQNIKIITTKTILSKPVKRFDLDNQYICSYLSLTEAALAMIELGLARGESSARTHISSVCRGKRKTAYRHIWKFA